jgi:hypothetical protein
VHLLQGKPALLHPFFNLVRGQGWHCTCQGLCNAAQGTRPCVVPHCLGAYSTEHHCSTEQ